ncbi:fungal-specific transcription factor domain-containing protein [Lipomyces kononenkoae]|uniref:Fungal-specific transcription factor domain-containing protein n=1 Tax=Lipomyces kononenkoae TaxID=34357 RepID=A0ACC3T110_LIPKO
MSSAASPCYTAAASAQADDDPTPPSGDYMVGDSDLKRRRIARACDCCRKKKIKCDGRMPSCTNCINYKTKCVFTYTEKKRNPAKGLKYIESLESRLEKMEGLIRSFVPEYRPESLDNHVDQDSAVAERIRSSVQSSTPSASQSQTSSPANVAPSNHPDNHCTPANCEDVAKHSVADEIEAHEDSSDEETNCFLITSRDGDSKFIGHASTFSLFSPRGLQWISERTGDSSFFCAQVDCAEDLNDDQGRFGFLDGNMIINASTMIPGLKPLGAKEHTTLPLPDIDTANRCSDIYVNIVGSILPIFTRDEMHRIINSVYSDKPFRIVDYCAMCAVLAAGLRLQTTGFPSSSGGDPMTFKSDPIHQETVEQSWGYFMNAMSYFNALACGASSLTAVQTLITLCIYLDGSDSAEVAYMIHSNAVRLAQRIGLHVKPSWYGLSEDEASRRRRIFWICYMIDKDMSLRTGRPPVINDQDVSVDPLVETSSSPYYIFSLMIRFSQIQSSTYTRLYSAAASHVYENQLLDTIGELDKALLEWRDSMPLQYRPDHEIIEQDSHLLLHLVYVHFAYYNCLTAIHRMSYHHLTWRRPRRGAATVSSAPRNPRVLASAALCVQAARATIYLLKYFDNVQKSCGWLVVYYILASLVTLFANCLQSPQQPSSRSDLALMSAAVKFVKRVFEGSHFLDKNGERAMIMFDQMVRVATMVVEKSEQENVAREGLGRDSTVRTGTTPTAGETDSTLTATTVTGTLPTGFGTNVANNSTKLPFAQGMEAYRTQQYMFGRQDSMGVYSTFASASTVLPPSPSGSTPSRNIDQETLFASTNSGQPSGLFPARNGTNSSNEESQLFNVPTLTEPIPLEQMMNSELPFIPKDIWNLPAIFSWDWGSGTSAARFDTGPMPTEGGVPDGGINIGTRTTPADI